MVGMRALTAAVAALAVVALTGCVENRGNLNGSVERLEHNADQLARDAADMPAGAEYPRTYVRDAHQLADDAHEFRHVAENNDLRNTDVRAAFRRVSASYHALRDDVDHSDSRELRADLQPVTHAYLDVEQHMGGYPERRASADPDYVPPDD